MLALLGVLLLLTPLAAAGTHSYIVKFVTYRHETRADFIKWINLDIVNQTFNGCFLFAKSIEEFQIRIKATVPKKTGGTWNYFDVTLDGCSLLGNEATRPFYLIDIVLTALKKTNPKMPDRCPMRKDTEYCYDHFSLKDIKLPRNFPKQRFNLLLELLQTNIGFYRGYFVMEIA